MDFKGVASGGARWCSLCKDGDWFKGGLVRSTPGFVNNSGDLTDIIRFLLVWFKYILGQV